MSEEAPAVRRGKSEILEMGLNFCRAVFEWPVKGGKAKLDDVMRANAAVAIGFVRQFRAEREAVFKGASQKEAMELGREVAAANHQWLSDPKTTDEQIKGEVFMVTRMLEEEVGG